MKVVIAGHFTFPTGGAPSARIRNFAMGFRDCGLDVHILAMAPMLSQQQGVQNYENIRYESTAIFDLSATNKWLNKMRWFSGLYGSVFPTVRRLQKLIDEGECDLFLSYGRNALLQLPLARLCKQHHIPTILDITEPSDYFQGLGGRLNPVYWDWQWGSKRMPQTFDTLTVITHYLKDYYSARGCRNVMVIPSIEGWHNLPDVHPLLSNDIFHLVYVGGLIDRDDPDILLDAMRHLAEMGCNVQLDIIGRYERYEEGRRRVKSIQSDPRLQKCINLIGEVSDEELALRLQEANGLILLRRNAVTEVASFPTRLIEYLKQGRPVFVSDVGDVSHYLRHQQDVILLSPSDSKQIAHAVAEVASLPDRGFTIGLQGRIQGEKCFNRKVYVEKLLNNIIPFS